MASEDLKAVQRDTFAAIQQLIAQSPSMAALQQSPSSIAALQMQLAQGQFGAGAAGSEESLLATGVQHLVFSLNDRELAVKAELVQGVERLVELTPVPNVAPWIKGVMNLRGSIISVVDLRIFLGLEQLPYTPRTRLLSLQYNDLVICVIVDGVSEMVPVTAGSIVSGNTRQNAIPSWLAQYSSGSVMRSNRQLIILDVAHLLFSEQMQNYSIRPYDN